MNNQPPSHRSPYHQSLIIDGRTSKVIAGLTGQMEARTGGTVWNVIKENDAYA